MPTIVSNTVGPSKTYTTLQSWEDASPANLVTADQIWEGQASGFFSAALTISGTTVDSTRFARLTTEAGASFRDNANVQTNALRYNASNGCAATFTTNYVFQVTINQDFCQISNMQFDYSATSGAAGSLVMAGNYTIDINNCIFVTNRPAGATLIMNGTDAKIRNSLIVKRAASGVSIAEMNSGASAYNCTFVVPSDFAKATDALVCKYSPNLYSNCAFFGATNVKSGSGTSSFVNCGCDDATPPSGATTYTYNTSLFVGVTDAARDYRLVSGSALINAGATDSTFAAIDIAKTNRPSGSNYDIGCWEFVAAAAGGFIPILGRGPGLQLAGGRGLAGE